VVAASHKDGREGDGLYLWPSYDPHTPCNPCLNHCHIAQDGALSIYRRDALNAYAIHCTWALWKPVLLCLCGTAQNNVNCVPGSSLGPLLAFLRGFGDCLSLYRIAWRRSIGMKHNYTFPFSIINFAAQTTSINNLAVRLNQLWTNTNRGGS
jgi:hypothetical protein